MVGHLGLVLTLLASPAQLDEPAHLPAEEAFGICPLPDDTDGDGLDDPSDNCPGTVNVDQVDEDLDGHGAACDCDDGLDSAWRMPHVTLRVARDSETRLDWHETEGPTAVAVTYDLVRATDAELTDATCLLTDTAAMTTTDPDRPAPAFFYVVRGQNDCGESAGMDSTGERPTPIKAHASRIRPPQHSKNAAKLQSETRGRLSPGFSQASKLCSSGVEIVC